MPQATITGYTRASRSDLATRRVPTTRPGESRGPAVEAPSFARLGAWAGLLPLRVLVAFLALGWPSADADESAPRAFWHNTRLLGSPEPPSPFVIQQVFTNVAWRNPLYLAPLPGTDRLWVVLQGGEPERPSRIVSIPDRNDARETEVETVLTLEKRLVYGLTFHPGFATNRWVFLFSNGPTGAGQRTNHIDRVRVSPQPPFRGVPESITPILEWPSSGHDGGDLSFGRDGMLYVTSGDGSSDSDSLDSGQDLSNLLATLIRIDVDHPAPGRAYAVPPDNPFLRIPGARPEIWAYGFRNPWRMDIDPVTGDIWVGQNGQDLWETAHLVRRGDNYGWSVFEGSHPFHPNRRRGPTPIVPPTIEHSHAEFRSLTGGVVYRGSELPELDGAYVYGDYGTGKIWGARHRDGKLAWHRELVDTALQIVAFRVDSRGRLLVVDHAGGIHRLAARPPAAPPPPFPTRLSDTGLFADVAALRPAPGLVPYDIQAPAWTDGAEARRFIALPGTNSVSWTGSRAWAFPNATVLVQTLSLPVRDNATNPLRRIETRLLVRQDGDWAGYAYRWNDEQTDAVLVAKEGEELKSVGDDTADRTSTRSWRIPSRAECLACHSRAAGFVLGITDPQMNRTILPAEPGAAPENQLSRLARLGILAGLPSGDPALRPALVNPYAPTPDLEARARSYLHANCSGCHVAAGGGNARMELEFSQSRDGMNLFEARPQHDTFGLADAMLVAPGHPERSVLVHRLSRRGRGQMPPLISRRIDERAVALMRDWIGAMKPGREKVRAWTLAELQPALAQLDQPRDAAKGRTTFQRLGCIQCHAIEGQGGNVGPALDDAGRRLGRVALLEAVLDPSKSIADAYVSHEIELRDGDLLSGRIERETDHEVFLRTGSGVDALVAIPRARIARRAPSPISNMPSGMLDVLAQDEILDLLAYLLGQDLYSTRSVNR